jgi:hypothetical protein
MMVGWLLPVAFEDLERPLRLHPSAWLVVPLLSAEAL